MVNGPAGQWSGRVGSQSIITGVTSCGEARRVLAVGRRPTTFIAGGGTD